MNKDLTPSQRIVQLLLVLLRFPYRYSRKELATTYQVDPQTIKRDLDVLITAGLVVDQNHVYRYAVLPEGQIKELKKLQTLTVEELSLIEQGLGQAFAKTSTAKVLVRKLKSLYDFQRLGLRALRRPELSKIDVLEKCIVEQKLANLIDYRSTNANETSNRLVEPFHLDTANGILHSFDLAKKAVRHFRLDRMVRVEALDEACKHATSHVVVPTDVFRIANSRQERVHLSLTVRAYNDLLERFPASAAVTLPSDEPDQFDFDALINVDFYGLLPFCLANWQGIAVHQPERLRSEIHAAARGILQKE